MHQRPFDKKQLGHLNRVSQALYRIREQSGEELENASVMDSV